MNIKEALEYGIEVLRKNNVVDPIFKTRIILADILDKDKEYLVVHQEEILDNNSVEKYKKCIDKLCKNIPLQYITNKQEFFGLEFYVDENVLIPQPDTEILVEEVINLSKGIGAIDILDLCTGSGAIGIALAKNIENSKVMLSDISKEALNVAEKNCLNNCVDCRIIKSDLFENIEDKFDIIVSNPPYIKSKVIKTLEKEVQNEPLLALDGGEDGLKIYRRIINNAYKYLKNNGYLCLEIGYDQKEEVIGLIEETNKYINIYSKKDLSGNNRIIICKYKEN